ncbi:Homeobox domain [Trinorchestia longiramus]|nr:Homeobox domain [Trinorchestia longiramus]
MLESYDTFQNSFDDLTESLHSDEATVCVAETIQLQPPSSQQPRTTTPTSYQFHLEELEETGSFFDHDSHYENDLVCLSGNSRNYGESNSYLDSVEQATNFSVEDCSENAENFQSHFSENFPASSISCSAGGESGPEEFSCADAAKELECQTEEQAYPNAENHFATKGKVNDLQRSALDAIFQITDRPSRVLVLYIASELQLHHVTVKNFFSNARRRVRRAAARLTDPERSKRENRKRKEKRRLAALSLASGSRAAGASGHCPTVENAHKNFKSSTSFKMSAFEQQYNASGCDEAHLKSTEIVSPKRRALMEKLVDKVQRSAAQKNLASVSDSRAQTPSNTQQISVHVVPFNSSTIWPADTSPSFSNFPLPFPTTPRPSEDTYENVFPLDSGTDSLHDKTHTTDEMSISGLTIGSESLSGKMAQEGCTYAVHLSV